MVRLILVFHPEVRGRLRTQTLEQGPLAKEPLVSTLYARERDRAPSTAPGLEGWALPSQSGTAKAPEKQGQQQPEA